MDSERCKELLEEYRTAIKAVKDAEQGARQAVVTEPLEPENRPSGGAGGLPQHEAYRREKDAKERLQAAEKAYRDCIDGLG